MVFMFKKSVTTDRRANTLTCTFSLILTVLAAAGFIGCSGDDGNGSAVSIRAVIGPEGGVVEVTDPGSPIYGAKLDVPGGAVDRRTVFSLSYDAPFDNDDLNAPPVVIEHEDVALNKDVTLTLPLKSIFDEAQSLVLMIYDDDDGMYVPTGLIVEINADDTSARVHPAHPGRFSLMPAIDALSSDDIDHKRLHALLAQLMIDIEHSIDSDSGILEEILDALLEDRQGGMTDTILREIILSGIRSIRSCNGDIPICAGKLAENARLLLERLPYLKGINICSELNTGEDQYGCFPQNNFPFIKCVPAVVNDSPDDDCMGRCGVGCPDDDNEFDDLLPCGDYFRYSQACLNHDACVRYYSLLDFRCDAMFSRLMNDCRNEQLTCTRAREICGDDKDNNGNGAIDEGCLN